MEAQPKANPDYLFPKILSGIAGLDEVTEGGLPLGRTTLVCGGPGAGKTLLGMQFLVCGATKYQENGAFISFEESAEELIKNVKSLSYDVAKLESEKKIVLEHIPINRNDFEEAGEYDLEGLFIRIGHAIDSIGAKRIVLDTIEAVFSDFSNLSVVRSELRRLFRWLKDKGVTAVVTAEKGEGSLTRYGLEEYVSDCVIYLDHRVIDQISTRRLRIVKYRGSTHGTNEYPFIMDRDGITVMPITSIGLSHEASSERVSSGVPKLDEMLGLKGYFRGASILVSGTAGTGKSSLAAHFVYSAAQRGERCIYFALEESEKQIVRNMRSIGIDLQPLITGGMLKLIAQRPTVHGLESHLAYIQKEIESYKPTVMVIDPITNLVTVGARHEVRLMMTRLIDFLKSLQITCLMTSLISGNHSLEDSEVGISSLIDTWISVRDIESNGERNRGMYILKSRGMAHSNQVREFLLTDHGIDLVDVGLSPDGILIGSARVGQEIKNANLRQRQIDDEEFRRLAFEKKKKALEAQIAALTAEIQFEQKEYTRFQNSAERDALRQILDQKAMARSRHVPEPNTNID